MKHHLLIPARTALAIFGLTLATGALTSPARADQWDKRTILTVNQPVQVTDTVLEPGQYVLRLLDSQSDRHVVQIFNRDQTHIINTVLAIPTERLQPKGKTEFSFWETPPGTYKALRTWYYPGDSFGQQFAYPKHLQQVAMLIQPEPAFTPAPEPAPAPAAEETAPAETPAQSETVTPEPAPEQQPTEMAQNAPPAAPAETPAESTPNQPSELPKTGSFYPAIGMSGALLICLGGLLKLRRRA
jgi:LPXTG-motif cell wall-anchored protein